MSETYTPKCIKCGARESDSWVALVYNQWPPGHLCGECSAAMCREVIDQEGGLPVCEVRWASERRQRQAQEISAALTLIGGQFEWAAVFDDDDRQDLMANPILCFWQCQKAVQDGTADSARIYARKLHAGALFHVHTIRKGDDGEIIHEHGNGYPDCCEVPAGFGVPAFTVEISQ